MEIVSFLNQDASLLSGVVVVLKFDIVQAYIRPFKSTLINILDLIFTGIFILLSVITLYLYSKTSGYDKVNIAVYVSGVLALFFVCLVIVFHLHIVVKRTKWYNSLPVIQAKFNLKDNWKSLSQSFLTESKNWQFR